MSNSELLERVRYFKNKTTWKYSDMVECDKFRQDLKFSAIGDLNFEVLDFFYDGMLSQIIADARERSERLGEYEGYTWGKRYLEHYVGSLCLVSKSEHPALHKSEAYDLVLDKLIDECEKGDVLRMLERQKNKKLA